MDDQAAKITRRAAGEPVAGPEPPPGGARSAGAGQHAGDRVALRRELRRRMLRGTASNAAGQAIGLITTFLLTPYVLHRIGGAEYGLWILVGQVMAYGGLLDLGIGAAVIKFVAEYRTTENVERTKALLATVLRVYLVVGLLVVGLSVVLARIVPELLRIDPADQQTAALLVLLMGLNLAVSIASAPTISILVGLHRFDLYNAVMTGGGIVGAVATVAVLAAGWGVVGMVAIAIPITLLGRAVSVRLIRRVAPDLPLGYAGARWEAARHILGFSSAVFTSHVSELLQKKTDEIVIGAVLAVSAVTPYALGRRLSEIPHVVTDQLLRVLLPVAAELHASEDREQLRALYLASTRLTIALFLSLGLAIAVLPTAILGAWVGPGYEDAAPVIVILFVASFLLTSQWPAGSILQGMARFGPVALSSLASGVANLVLSIVLVRRLGMKGVALGTLVPTAAETMGFVLPYTMWVLAVSPARALREVWLPALAPAFPATIVLLALRELLHPASLLMVALVASTGSLVYALCYLSLPASTAERHTLLDAGREVVAAARRLRRGDRGG